MLTRGDGPLQFGMAGLAQEIAETDHAHGFADKVYGQSRRREAEHARIQFLSSALQVGASHRELSAIQSCSGDQPHRFCRSQNLCPGLSFDGVILMMTGGAASTRPSRWVQSPKPTAQNIIILFIPESSFARLAHSGKT